MKRVVIVGAGISGLALARALRALGEEPLVLESEPRAGGKIRSQAADGFLWEWGPASFRDGDPAVAALLRELGLEARRMRASEAAKRRCVVVGSEVLPVPVSPGAFLLSRILPLRAKLRVFGELLLPRGPSGRGEEESVAAFACRRLGTTAAERLFYPLISALYAGDPEQISLPAMFPMLAELERDHRSLLLGALRTGLHRRAAELPSIVSFPHGVEELTRALAQELGDGLRLRAAVRRVERCEGGYSLRVEERDRTVELGAAAVALTLPAHAAVSAMASLDVPAADALRAIPYIPVTLLHAGYPAGAFPRPLDAYGFLVPPTEPLRILGAVFISCVFPGRAPDRHVLVSIRIGGVRQPELAALPDGDLVDLVSAELRGPLGVQEPPSFVRICRHEHALPQYTLGHRDRIAAIDAAEERHPGLYITGKAYRGLGIPDCIRNAAPLAQRIVTFLRNRGAGTAPAG